MEENKTTVNEFIKNQKEYCKEHGVPFFMPNKNRCWSCSGQLISELIKRGRNGKQELITGCPICNRSFVD